ncbi:hypothetical protein [Pimelobacter simplex]|uniref:hypothetical protein n=1 Tax=Nocardioides simplex TaxID=2045 RepID=UPI003AADA990
MSSPAEVPSSARVLHIGPHKTGTTALQSALHQARKDLAAQGVRYLSPTRHDAAAARWITGRLVAGMDRDAARGRWEALVGEMTRTSGDRRIYSSEFLSDAKDAQIAQVVDELGAEDLWVVVTLRPLAKILPSQYQQGIQRLGLRKYDDFLHSVLDEEPAVAPPPQFWVRHAHDELTRRWAAHVGPERVIVVVLDAADHQFLPHAFEEILGLRPETLASREAKENRSLTAAEVEVLRQFNAQFKALGLGPDLYARFLAHFRDHLKARTPASGEARMITPDWAVARANEIGRSAAERLRASGVTVLGDLDSLSGVALPGVAETPEAPASVDTEFAGWFAAGLAASAQQLLAAQAPPPAPPSEAEPGLRDVARRGMRRLRGGRER